jgi:hypothetical protein
LASCAASQSHTQLAFALANVNRIHGIGKSLRCLSEFWQRTHDLGPRVVVEFGAREGDMMDQYLTWFVAITL